MFGNTETFNSELNNTALVRINKIKYRTSGFFSKYYVKHILQFKQEGRWVDAPLVSEYVYLNKRDEV